MPESVAGRDATLPPWMVAGEPPPGSPRYDSAVVRGNGVGALICAARLARSDAFAGRVTLAAPPVAESRRLIGGLTLRARALDYYGAALGSSRRELLEEMFAGRAASAQTRLQRTAVCDRQPSGAFSLSEPATWLRSEDRNGRVLAYGLRNAALVAALRRVMAGLDLHFHEELPMSAADCRELARGGRPVVIDAGGGPLADAPSAPAPSSFVLASQLPFADTHRVGAGLLPEGSGFFGVLPRRRGVDIGIYNPIADALSPDAVLYGIVYRIVRQRERLGREALAMRALQERHAAELADLRDRVVGVARAMGFEPVDESETLGQAVMPCQPWRDVPPRDDDVVELRRLYDAGAPIITGDGMLRAGLAGLVAAECILAGVAPTPHVNRALRGWRRANRGLARGMTRLAPLLVWGARRFPVAVVGGGGRLPDTWAGLE